MRAVALHADVLVATSAVLQVNCVIVRGPVEDEGETFVIDSPVLPDELFQGSCHRAFRCYWSNVLALTNRLPIFRER